MDVGLVRNFGEQPLAGVMADGAETTVGLGLYCLERVG